MSDNTSDVDNIPFRVIAADYYAKNVEKILWLSQFNVLGPTEMAGGSPVLGGVSGIDLGFALSVPIWVKNDRDFVSWAQELQRNYMKTGSQLTADELDEFVALGRSYGVKIKPDVGHVDTPWPEPHLNVGNKGQAHIIVPIDWTLPPLR